MTQVSVGLGARSYEIVIEANALDKAGATLASFARDGRLTLVTDSNVANHVLPRLSVGLAKANITPEVIILSPGEGTKNWDQLASLCDDLLARGIQRSDTIVALGAPCRAPSRCAGRGSSSPRHWPRR